MMQKKFASGKNGFKNLLNKPIWAWALYDWANSAFACTIMAGLFPIFFKSYWSAEVDTSTSTYYLGIGNSIAGIILALSAPFLGALADASQRKKFYLFGFTVLGVFSSAALFFTPYGSWEQAVTFYALGTIGFAAGNIFYDALLLHIASREKIHIVSGLGYALGYLGGGLLFTLNVLTILKPEWFGFDKIMAVRISFLSVALWWTLFSIPLFLWVKEPHKQANSRLLYTALQELQNTLRQLPKHPHLWLFLVAYLFYIDGVNTTIKMAVDYGISLGFASDSLLTALLITQFVGFPAAIAFGYLGQKFGPKSGIYIALIGYMAVILWAYQMDTIKEFYLMAICIGLIQGGIQSLSRSYYGLLIPKESAAEFFGLYNMLGKFSSVLGPFLVGYVSLKTHNPRVSILVILIFFIIGGTLLKVQGHYKANLKGSM